MLEPVTLTSSDNINRVIERTVAEMSLTIKDVLEDVVDPSKPVPLIRIDVETLDVMIKYMKHHTDHPEDHLDHSDKLDDMSEWDIEFCNGMEINVLFKVILASNYLDIPPLLGVLCKFVAVTHVRGKRKDEIKKTLKLNIDK